MAKRLENLSHMLGQGFYSLVKSHTFTYQMINKPTLYCCYLGRSLLFFSLELSSMTNKIICHYESFF